MSSAAQRTFMQNGGIYSGILQAKYDTRELVPPDQYEFQQYPELVRVYGGKRDVQKSTLRIRGKEEMPFEWTEEVEMWEDHIVNSDEEKERVLNGGKSNAQIEDEREELYTQCKNRGLSVERAWPLFRLQQALGTAPSASEVSDLRQKVADLEEKAALQARIAELEAKLSAVPYDEADEMRDQLRAAGVEVDKRWGVARLRSELERATDPEA